MVQVRRKEPSIYTRDIFRGHCVYNKRPIHEQRDKVKLEQGLYHSVNLNDFVSWTMNRYEDLTMLHQAVPKIATSTCC